MQPDAIINRYKKSVAVGSCYNTYNKECRFLKRKEIPGQPLLCPVCNNAIFWERIPRSRLGKAEKNEIIEIIEETEMHATDFY